MYSERPSVHLPSAPRLWLSPALFSSKPAPLTCLGHPVLLVLPAEPGPQDPSAPTRSFIQVTSQQCPVLAVGDSRRRGGTHVGERGGGEAPLTCKAVTSASKRGETHEGTLAGLSWGTGRGRLGFQKGSFEEGKQESGRERG